MFNGSSKKNTVAPGSTTLVAKGTLIRGDIRFTGAFYLEGRVEGTLTAEDDGATLTVGDQGGVVGEIRAPRVTVNGEIKGDIHATERLELAGAAQVEGNVYYKVLEMVAGARINGKMVHQDAEPKRLTGPEPLPAVQAARA